MADTYDELMRRGVKAAQDEDYDEAEDLIEQALEVRPGNVQAMNMLGYVFWKRDDPREAERYYRASLDVDPSDAYARKGLGLCLVDQGLVDEGVGEIKRAIDLRRNWAEPYHDLGIILARNKRFEESWQVLDVATKLDRKLVAQVGELLEQVKARAAAETKAKAKAKGAAKKKR